ncbi:hypothetical protein AB0J25_12030 [Streptomyces sp. NPDC049910]|uniref:hypothetical protein n=1 Tax=Streptomyces sp. NPDC049910 TaxID=3155278 RepID=UPI00341BD05F
MATDDLRRVIRMIAREELYAQLRQHRIGEYRAAVLLEAADAINALPQDYECDPGRGDAADLLRRMAGHGGSAEKDTREGESTPTLTVYRASHESIVMGLYTTATEARAHCVAEERRAWAKNAALVFDWIEDEEDGVAELVTVNEDGETEHVTGYVVAALEVASRYDPEADE